MGLLAPELARELPRAGARAGGGGKELALARWRRCNALKGLGSQPGPDDPVLSGVRSAARRCGGPSAPRKPAAGSAQSSERRRP